VRGSCCTLKMTVLAPSSGTNWLPSGAGGRPLEDTSSIAASVAGHDRRPADRQTVEGGFPADDDSPADAAGGSLFAGVADVAADMLGPDKAGYEGVLSLRLSICACLRTSRKRH
jgi:hypothetical protein